MKMCNENDADAGKHEMKNVLDNFLEQRQCFRHAVLRFVLEQLLVVLGNGCDKKHGRHILKAVNPFLALVALPADVVHLERVALHEKARFDNACGAHTRAQNVLRARHIAGRANLGETRKEILGRVIALKLGAAAVNALWSVPDETLTCIKNSELRRYFTFAKPGKLTSINMLFVLKQRFQ